ncbi:MAG: phenylalanine--tRNA ligase subunit beta [Alphaproteobacteria bacterium]|nr:phenylalanine--tRNA ligase subunit beta [Alphaproteobacteria bacterium]
MKFPLSWLKQHLDTDASLDVLCDTLTAIGLEVENVEAPGKKLAPFIVAQIKEAVDHPDSDHLHVCKVDTGSEILQVVCGAPNARAGLKVVLARPGDVMPDTGKALKAGKIRGVESCGMMCAVDELGIGDEHEGIIELGEDAPVGGSFAAYAGYDDPVIEINLTPNRPDCAGVFGIARDLAAAGLGTLKKLDVTPVKGTEPCGIKISLDLPDNNKACPLFVGRVIRNIQNGPSPEWLQKKLRAVGLRPISALVDITNYLTIDCARPLHVFDADKIKGTLWVGEAEGGETLEALNDKTYTLEKGMTVIGDDTGVLSLAGVVGGVGSACDEKTTNVLIEAAYFDPVRTAITGRTLQIPSDARYRFERGVDPLFTQPGAELAAKLVIELCGTADTVVSELEVVGAVAPRTAPIALDLGKCLKHTGLDVSADEQRALLEKLGFTVTAQEQSLSVLPPSWRPDIDNDADLVEEIVRLKGYEHLPVVSLPNAEVVTRLALDEDERRAHTARRALAGRGLMEALTWSFLSASEAEAFGGVNDALRLTNPISVELCVMRPSLLPNLMAAAKRNLDRGLATVRLFEVGPTFHDTMEDGQIPVASALRAGAAPRHWAETARAPDAFDAKADAMAVLEALGVPVGSLQVTTDAPAWYHPGRSGCLRLGPNLLAAFGEIHPQLRENFSSTEVVVGCEVFLANIPATRAKGTARPLLKLETLQPIRRDFAFVLDRAVPADKVIRAAYAADKKLIRAVDIFDVYEGDKIDEGKKSLALSVTIQPQDKTLTDTEIDALAAKIGESVTKATGAVLRK